MAFDPKSLTIDYKTLMESTSISDRVAMTKSKQGQQLLSSLNPSDMANIFPDYYKKSNPDVSGFIEATSKRYGRGKDKTPGAEYSEEAKGDNKGGSSYNPGARTGTSGSGAGRTSGDYTPSVLDRLKETTKEDFTPTSPKGKGIDRSRFSGDMQNDETRMRMYALAISEVGASADPSSKIAIMETMFNRTDAQKRGSISGTISRNDDPKKNYYAPYNDGAYDRNLKLLKSNPKLVEEMDSHLKEVLSGSNEANYATDNASGTVAANAMYTQSFQGKTGSGESLFIKDKDDPASIKQHGAAVVRNNKEFRARSEAQVAEYARKKQQNIEVAEDPKANKVLPENIHKDLKDYYNSKNLSQAQRDEFAIKLNKSIANRFNGDIDKLNSDFAQNQKASVPGKGYVNINPDRIIADVMQGKISPEDSMVATAMSMKGIDEKKQRNELMEFFKSDKTSSVDPSKPGGAWCASFVNSSLANVGIKGTGSAAAGSFHTWGDTVSDQKNPKPENIKKGDVFVNYNVSKATGMTGNHTGITTGPAFQGKDGQWYVKTISGNLGDTVGEETVRVNDVRVGRAPLTNEYYNGDVLKTVQAAKAKEIAPEKPIIRSDSNAQTAPASNAQTAPASNAQTAQAPNAQTAPASNAQTAQAPTEQPKTMALGGEIRGINDASKLTAQPLAKEIRTSGGKENTRLSYNGKAVADVNDKEALSLDKGKNTLNVTPENRVKPEDLKQEKESAPDNTKDPVPEQQQQDNRQPQQMSQHSQDPRRQPPDETFAPISHKTTDAYARLSKTLDQEHFGTASVNPV